jgi:exopolysaccharide biosynthesis polyprenyl glycosylphosphotransferase
LHSLHEQGGVRYLKEGRSGPRVSLLDARPAPEEVPSGTGGRPRWNAPQRGSHRLRSAGRWRLIGVDVTSLLVGWWVGWLVADAGTPLLALSAGVGLMAAGVVATIACFYVVGLYRLPVTGIRSGALSRLLQAMTMAAMIIVIWQASLDDVAPKPVLSSMVAALLASVVARYGFDVWLIGRRASGSLGVPVVVGGTAIETASLVEFLQLNPESGFRATAIIGERPALGDSASEDAPWTGGLEHAAEAVARTGASGVLLAINGLAPHTVNDLVVGLSSAGIATYLSSGLTGVSGSRLQTISVAHQPVTLVDPSRHSSVQELTKRFFDVVLASLLLILTAPVMLIAAVLIKLQDRGPVFFRQVRIGQGGEPFTLVKLRTMEIDADARLGDLRHRNERHGPLFKVSNDPRVTPVGGFLRSAAIDELPQLFNVLAGDMSIVGPRPALPAEAAQFDDDLQRRHLVRPGVTGLWQIEANHKASFDEYRRLDLFYVDNWSVAMDLAVTIDTVPVICRRALRALRRSAPSAPAPIGSAAPVPKPIDVGS